MIENKVNRILVSGSSGFVGSNYQAHSIYKDSLDLISLQNQKVKEINFKGISHVVHLAGIAHRMDQPSGEIYYKVNRDLTFDFAQRAKEQGVKQFVFISTVKVYNDTGEGDLYFNEQSPCEPTDDYGKSKLEAERKLIYLQDEDFTISIVRPPLIYGKGVKGNLDKLMNLIQTKSWAPLGGIGNKRSMVYVKNLIALIDHLVGKNKAGIYIAGDNKLISTTYLAELIKKHLGKEPKFNKLPSLFRNVIKILKPNIFNRLFCSYVVDHTNSANYLNYKNPYSVEEGIQEMVEHFIKSKNTNNGI